MSFLTLFSRKYTLSNIHGQPAGRLSRQTEYMHWLLQHSFQIMYIRPATRGPCWLTSLLKHRWGRYTFGIVSLITTYTYVLLRSASKDNPWNEVSIFQLGLKSVVFLQSCGGMLQAKFKFLMEPKRYVAKPKNKTSRNHRGFQKFFHSFTSVQSSPTVLPLHQIYPCCLWISCRASPSFVTKVLVLQFL